MRASSPGVCVHTTRLLTVDIVSVVVFPVVLGSWSLSAVALIVSQSVCSCSSRESVSACNYVGESVLACYTCECKRFPVAVVGVSHSTVPLDVFSSRELQYWD